MKKIVLFILVSVLLSCTDQDAFRKEEARKAELKREEVYEVIRKNWNFSPADFTEEAYTIVEQWPEWNNFYNELLQKPQTDIGAFQRKTRTLVTQSESLQSTIPEVFNVTEIQSRFTVLETKIKMLKMYITIDDIDTKDIIRTVNEINVEVESIVSRMKTILDKNKIQIEEGEAEMLRSLDSLRQDLKTLELDVKTQSN